MIDLATITAIAARYGVADQFASSPRRAARRRA